MVAGGLAESVAASFLILAGVAFSPPVSPSVFSGGFLSSFSSDLTSVISLNEMMLRDILLQETHYGIQTI